MVFVVKKVRGVQGRVFIAHSLYVKICTVSYGWGDIKVYQQRGGTVQNEPLHDGFFDEMLQKIQKQGP